MPSRPAGSRPWPAPVCPHRPAASAGPAATAALHRAAAMGPVPAASPACRGTGRSDCRSAGNDLVRSAAIGRAVRPGRRGSDADMAERRPRERRFARLARGLARLARGRHGVSQTPQQPNHRFPGNDPRGPPSPLPPPHTPIGPRPSGLPIATRSSAGRAEPGGDGAYLRFLCWILFRPQ